MIAKKTEDRTLEYASKELVHSGYFHGYYKKPNPYSLYFQKRICTIPAGSKFILGDLDEICSNQMIVNGEGFKPKEEEWERIIDIYHDIFFNFGIEHSDPKHLFDYGAVLLQAQVEKEESFYFIVNIFDKEQIKDIHREMWERYHDWKTISLEPIGILETKVFDPTGKNPTLYSFGKIIGRGSYLVYSFPYSSKDRSIKDRIELEDQNEFGKLLKNSLLCYNPRTFIENAVKKLDCLNNTWLYPVSGSILIKEEDIETDFSWKDIKTTTPNSDSPKVYAGRAKKEIKGLA